MITYVTGDMFSSDRQTLVNAVNTVGVMGKGLALQFKERYPAMYKQYRLKCERDELRIGTLHLYTGYHHWILNFPTKRHYKSKSRLQDVEIGLARLRDEYVDMRITSLALPALGCGYGGLDWKDVQPLIEHYLGDLPIPIEVYAPLPEGQEPLPAEKRPLQPSLFDLPSILDEEE